MNGYIIVNEDGIMIADTFSLWEEDTKDKIVEIKKLSLEILHSLGYRCVPCTIKINE